MYTASEKLNYCSLSSSRQQLLEKVMEFDDTVLDSSMPRYSIHTDKVISSVINIVTKDSAPDTIKRISKLNKGAATCVRR